MQVDVSGVDISKRGQTKQKSESPQRKALHCHPPRSVAGILHLMLLCLFILHHLSGSLAEHFYVIPLTNRQIILLMMDAECLHCLNQYK